MRTSDNIDMKLGLVTKHDKRNKTTSSQPRLSRYQLVAIFGFSIIYNIWSGTLTL